MKGIILFAAFVFILCYQVFAQNDSIPTDKIWKTGINYKSYVLVNNDLFALNDSGKLIIWDLNKLDTIHFAHNNPSLNYTAIAKDRNNNIFLGTRKGDIFKISPGNLSYSLYLKAKYTIRYMCFNASNELFLIVQNAVYDPSTKRYWDQFENHTTGLVVTKRSYLFFHKKVKKYFAMPSYTFLDSEGKWWMTAVYGEFGGELEIFDTENEAIVDNKFAGISSGNLTPRSVFEDDEKNIYITCGLQHFMNFGEIYRIDKNRNAIKVFDGQIKINPSTLKNPNTLERVFVGPGAYNKFDKHIYFATSAGFYKADTTGDGIKPEFLFNINTTWSREPLAIGVTMSILRLDFTADNKLFFLTENDGFGIYDGKNLLLFK